MLQQIRKLIPETHPLRLMYHKLWAILAAYRYGFPGKKLVVVGVTGTDGKTTTSTFIHSILNTSGRKTGLAATTHFSLGGENIKNTSHKTTLGRFGLQKLLKQMVDNGCTHAVIETSSHAIKQQRIWGINYEVSVITNITPEHLDYHPSYTDYRDTKISLLQMSKKAVVNLDDTTNLTAINNRVKDKNVLYFSTNTETDIFAKNINMSLTGSKFDIHSQNSKFKIQNSKLCLPGSFNISNALAAAAVCLHLDVPIEDVQKGLSKVKIIPGRMEKIPSNKPLDVFIDFAMTEEGYKNLLDYFSQVKKNNLWIVFGCCGDRDKAKRSKIGYIAMQKADYVIITDDEPYTENPEHIRNMIEEGVLRANGNLDENYFVIPSRREAFEYAINNAKEGDCIVVPGMGDLDSITVGTKHIPWSDREELIKLLQSS